MQHHRVVCNVLVIGTGAAGIRAAIAAESAGCDVVLVGKRTRSDPHTVLAAGGINAALGTVDPQDSWEQHYVDTMREGYGLGDPRAVELLARESPDVVSELEAWGCPFARTAEGKLDQRYFGAHRYRRTCYAGDYTGRAIVRTLVSRLMQTNVAVVEQMYIAELLIRDVRPSSEGYQDLGVALDLRGSIIAAEATLRSALERRESRGAHQRSDHPAALGVGLNTRVKSTPDGGMKIQSVLVPKATDGLPDWEAGDELLVTGRLLE